MILWSVWVSIEIFTGKREVYNIFGAPLAVEETGSESAGGANGGSPDSQPSDEIKDAISNQLQNFLPKEAMTKTMNLGAWSAFVFILIFAGAKMASLGIKLLASIREKEYD